jgi:hypothetical protein
MSHGWDENKHPRVPAGSSAGGQFGYSNKGYKFPAGDEDQINNDEQARNYTKDKWGKELDRTDLAELSGAQPNSRINIYYADPEESALMSGGEGDALGVHIEFMGEDGFPIGQATRYVTAHTIYNHELEFDRGFKGKGHGLRVFGQQVDAAVKHDYDSIETQAAGNWRTLDWQNGYYTWARMGYDGVIPNGYGPGGERTIHEVMKRPDGAAWWKANGESFFGTFYLHEGSTSRRVFDEYRRLKAQGR